MVGSCFGPGRLSAALSFERAFPQQRSDPQHLVSDVESVDWFRSVWCCCTAIGHNSSRHRTSPSGLRLLWIYTMITRHVTCSWQEICQGLRACIAICVIMAALGPLFTPVSPARHCAHGWKHSNGTFLFLLLLSLLEVSGSLWVLLLLSLPSGLPLLLPGLTPAPSASSCG